MTKKFATLLTLLFFSPAHALTPLTHSVELKEFVSGFEEITDFHFMKDSIWVLEKSGTLWELKLRGKDRHSLLKLSVRHHSELGLLGMAVHPDFKANRKVYLNYNPATGPLRTRVSEWKLSKEQNRLESERVLFEIEQPYSNHNGGQLAFGPDGLLYIGMGDGGSGGDPKGHAQNPKSLLGKMLRIQVNDPAAKPEIFASGLRNPWRFSFTPDGRIVTGDVGQNQWEEISIVSRGANLGWNQMEGFHCFGTETCKKTSKDGQPLFGPVFEYGRDQGQSITGGFVYTGKTMPRLKDMYVFGDFASGFLAAIDLPKTGRSEKYQPLGKWPMNFSTFAQDSDGEIYVADFRSGKIFKLGPGKSP